MQPWNAPLDQLLDEFGSDRQLGLTAAKVEPLRSQHGPNQLEEAPRTPLWLRLLRQFNDAMVWLLIVAAIIAGVMQEVVDCIAILAIVLMNGFISFLQEERAESSLAALKKMSAPHAKVVRGGHQQMIEAAELVPGDVLLLEAGDYVPADVRLIEAFGLATQEAPLTGESTPVEKDAAVELPENTPLGDRRNLAFMGTVVTAGKASALVVDTGMRTQLGQIAGMLSSQEREQTPLQRRLARLGKVLAAVCLGLVAIVFAMEARRSANLLEVFLVSISLAVAAVPEGLPAVVTFALALGIGRMVKRNAIIRKLPAIETLGCVTVVCSDKTGTLTRNEMTVRTLLAGHTELRLSGTGYELDGEIGGPSDHPDVTSLLQVAVRCNNAKVRPKTDGSSQLEVIGDPTEIALLVAAKKAGFAASENPVLVSELPFDSQRKAMSVIVREQDRTTMYTKGAPEVVLKLCRYEQIKGQRIELTENRRREIMEQNAGLARQALRVLGFAFRPDVDPASSAEQNLTFAGLIGMIDPPREEAKEAISLCRSAGIRPVMITGDHPATAEAIARELGLLDGEALVLTGAELQELSDEAFRDQVDRVAVYARVSAQHKLRIVKAWQQREQIVAMTGDGVNDAPAVKAADVGVAMGIAGTDVTKEASDMVLTDDNFRSIVGAVEQGRGIYDNIQNCIRYLLSCNAGEVLFMFVAIAIGWPMPLVAVQILWINLVTDGLPALALVLEPPDRDIMRRPPRSPREQILNWQRGSLIAGQGVLIAAAAAAGFWGFYQGSQENLVLARTAAFCIMAYSQLFFSFACRSDHFTLPQLGLFTNRYLLFAIAGSAALQFAVVMLPWTQRIFDVVPPSWPQWSVILLLSLVPVSIVEVGKIVMAMAREPRTS